MIIILSNFICGALAIFIGLANANLSLAVEELEYLNDAEIKNPLHHKTIKWWTDKILNIKDYIWIIPLGFNILYCIINMVLMLSYMEDYQPNLFNNICGVIAVLMCLYSLVWLNYKAYNVREFTCELNEEIIKEKAKKNNNI